MQNMKEWCIPPRGRLESSYAREVDRAEMQQAASFVCGYFRQMENQLLN